MRIVATCQCCRPNFSFLIVVTGESVRMVEAVILSSIITW